MGYFLTVTVTATMKCPTGRYRHHLTDSWQRPHEAGTVPVSTPQIRDEAERAQQVGAGTGTHHVLDAQRREGKVSWVFSSRGRNLGYILEKQACPSTSQASVSTSGG